MHYLVNGKPVDGVPTGDLRRLSVAHEKPEAEAVLISTDDALRRYTRILKILYGFIGFIITLVPPALVAADPRDWTFLLPPVLAIWAFFAWFMPFMYKRKIRQFTARMTATNLPAAPGTKLRVDQTGLTIGGKSWEWSRLAIEAIGLERVQTGGGDFATNSTILQSLDLTAGTERIALDGNTLSTGNALLDQIYRRLKPAA